MSLNQIINEAADDADEFLKEIRIAKEARPVIREWIDGKHPELSPAERDSVAAGVFQILQNEGFFSMPERRTGLFGGEDANELTG